MNIKNYIKVLLIALSFVVVVGCGGGGSTNDINISKTDIKDNNDSLLSNNHSENNDNIKSNSNKNNQDKEADSKESDKNKDTNEKKQNNNNKNKNHEQDNKEKENNNTKDKNITNEPPYVYAGSDKTVIVNETVKLEGIASDTDGEIVSYKWKLGDKVLATTKSFEFTPKTEGTKILIFSATDDEGATSSDSVVITVNSPVTSDLKFINAKFVDNKGNDINKDNKYEQGEALRVEVTIENIGEKEIPERDSYMTDIDSDFKFISLPKLKKLAPSETVTFTYNVGENAHIVDDKESKSISINVNRTIFDDDAFDIDKHLFPENNKTNNIINTGKVYVYNTDIVIQDLKVKVLDNKGNLIRDNNTIILSKDNKDGNYASFCFKIKNIGEHIFNDITNGKRIIYKTGSIGNYYILFGNPNVKLQPNEISEEICANIELPKDFNVGNYIYELNATKYPDSNPKNNVESISYTIKN